MTISFAPLWQLIFKRKIKQKDLWEAAHISASTCQKLRNNQNVTTDVLVRICEVLDCDLSDIMVLERNKQCQKN